MSRKCEVNGKKPVFGNNVSHANNKTKKTWNPNLHRKRLFNPDTGAWIALKKVSSRGLRTIQKIGVSEAVKRGLIKA